MKSFSITSVIFNHLASTYLCCKFIGNLHIYDLCMKHIFLVKPILAGPHVLKCSTFALHPLGIKLEASFEN